MKSETAGEDSEGWDSCSRGGSVPPPCRVSSLSPQSNTSHVLKNAHSQGPSAPSPVSLPDDSKPSQIAQFFHSYLTLLPKKADIQQMMWKSGNVWTSGGREFPDPPEVFCKSDGKVLHDSFKTWWQHLRTVPNGKMGFPNNQLSIYRAHWELLPDWLSGPHRRPNRWVCWAPLGCPQPCVTLGFALCGYRHHSAAGAPTLLSAETFNPPSFGGGRGTVYL